jgi:hypothetical protein
MRATSVLWHVGLVLWMLVARIQALDNGLGKTPPMGNCIFSSRILTESLTSGWVTWCTENGMIPCYDDYCDEKELMSVADAMASNGILHH